MAQPRSSAPFLNAGFEDTDVVNAGSQTSRDPGKVNKAEDERKSRPSPIWTLWSRGWTAETCAFMFSVLTLGGLVTTLLAHQDKPQPKWPQLITINSVVSLFSLLMRTGVSVVLAEGKSKSVSIVLRFETLRSETGISQARWRWYREPRSLSDAERFDAASRGPWGSFLLLCHMRPHKA